MSPHLGLRRTILPAFLIVVGLSSSALRADQVLWPMTAHELALQREAEQKCGSQLAGIMRAAYAWALDNADQPPPGLHVLTNEIEFPARLCCPAVFRDLMPTNWSQLDWAKPDYQWVESVNWSDPADTACRCLIHDATGLVEGTFRLHGYRAGWPLLSASPMDVTCTPGEPVRFEFRLAPSALTPVSVQWRRAHLENMTNISRIRDPENPTSFIWVTNVVPVFIGANVAGETNLVLSFAAVTAEDSGYYSVIVSNTMGASLSRHASLVASAANAGINTNALIWDALCAHNLRQLYLLAGLWSQEHQQLFPHRFSEFTNSWGQPICGWPAALFCPADTNAVVPATWAGFDFGKASYEMPETEWLNGFDVFCRCRVHGYSVCVDGTVMLRPLLRGISSPGAGLLSVAFRTFAGRKNLLEASSDLVNWQPLAVYGPEPGEFQYTDIASQERLFYRLRLQ